MEVPMKEQSEAQRWKLTRVSWLWRHKLTAPGIHRLNLKAAHPARWMLRLARHYVWFLSLLPAGHLPVELTHSSALISDILVPGKNPDEMKNETERHG